MNSFWQKMVRKLFSLKTMSIYLLPTFAAQTVLSVAAGRIFLGVRLFHLNLSLVPRSYLVRGRKCVAKIIILWTDDRSMDIKERSPDRSHHDPCLYGYMVMFKTCIVLCVLSLVTPIILQVYYYALKLVFLAPNQCTQIICLNRSH